MYARNKNEINNNTLLLTIYISLLTQKHVITFIIKNYMLLLKHLSTRESTYIIIKTYRVASPRG